ncbi:Steroid 5-alpha-reductase det2 [Podochytrium sp. JEL0797]|nr:Steroid 5-alpha-reductase det2 [Podochytrium sp. JEL0797]
MAAVFNVANGFVNGVAAGQTRAERVNEWQFWVGIMIFLLGMTVNISADYRLFALRRVKASRTKGKYFIPTGGMFEFVSGANYFGEILEWAGWAIAAGNVAGYAFLFFTMANLIPRGLATHSFYVKTFGKEYPQARKADASQSVKLKSAGRVEGSQNAVVRLERRVKELEARVGRMESRLGQKDE